MALDEEAGKFSIIMHHCPSKGRLLEEKHIESYPVADIAMCSTGGYWSRWDMNMLSICLKRTVPDAG